MDRLVLVEIFNFQSTNDFGAASMAALPMAFGCILGGFLMERFGRKTTHLIAAVPCIVGWMMIFLASSIELLLLGRFFTGLVVGILGPPSSVYIGETSAPKYRGFLLAAISLAIAVGLLFAHFLGTFLPWKLTAVISVSLPCLAFLLLLLVPESPSWLAKKGRLKEAEQAFLWCRGHSLEAKEEMYTMLEAQKITPTTTLTRKEKLSLLLRKEFLKPLAIINVFFITTQFCGVNAITFYSVTIMQDTVGDGLDRYASMLIIDVIRVAMSVLACVLLRKCGRRPLTIISGFGSAASLFALSGFIYLASLDPTLLRLSFVPLTALIGYITFVSLGMVPLPWALNGELFPLAVREYGSGISSCVAFAAFFLVVKTSPIFFAHIGAHGTFLVYGSVAFLGTVFLCAFLPETKDKTLQEIEDYFKGDGK